jgi:hypothetical protein
LPKTIIPARVFGHHTGIASRRMKRGFFLRLASFQKGLLHDENRDCIDLFEISTKGCARLTVGSGLCALLANNRGQEVRRPDDGQSKPRRKLPCLENTRNP